MKRECCRNNDPYLLSTPESLDLVEQLQYTNRKLMLLRQRRVLGNEEPTEKLSLKSSVSTKELRRSTKTTKTLKKTTIRRPKSASGRRKN